MLSNMEETVRYNYRLRPGSRARQALIADWHRTRFLWNDAVAKMRNGEDVSFKTLSASLTAKRAELDWLKAGAQVTQQQELRTFAQALTHSFKVKGRRRPRFKSVNKARLSLAYTTNGFSLEDGRLRLAKTPPIPVVWSRELPSKPSSARVYQDSLGQWYVSFVVQRATQPAPPATGAIGIDWGVSETATTTDADYDLAHIGHRQREARTLANAQRKMARRRRPRGQAQSNGYKQARLETARIAKAAQRRNVHTARMWSRRIVDDHQLIAIEDFKPKFLSKSTMARKTADAAVGTIKSTLIEYAERAGRKVVLVKPAYTTMTCNQCFARTKRLGLDVRKFNCLSCGLSEDRDRNAAKTILAVAGQGHTSVDGVRRSGPPLGVAAQAAT